MEFFDVYNEDGSLAGYKAGRGETHRKGLWHRTVHIWILNSQAEVLLQKRAMDKETFPGLWDISCAGHVDAGELPEDAAIRELSEELGIQISKKELQYLFTIRQCYHKDNPLIIDNEFAEVFLLRSTQDIDSMKCNEEVTDLKWADISELANGRLENVAGHGEEYLNLQQFLRDGKHL